MSELADESLDGLFNDEFYYATPEDIKLSLRDIEVKRKHSYIARQNSSTWEGQ